MSLERRRKARLKSLVGTVENVKSQAKSWQAEREGYVRENPTRGLGCSRRGHSVGSSSS